MSSLFRQIVSTACLIVSFTLSLNAQSDSIIKVYNSQGILIEERREVNGKTDGVLKWYNDSLGYLFRTLTYKMGYEDGPCSTYNPKGIVILTGYYSIKAAKNHKKYNKEIGGYEYSYEPLPVGEWLYYDDTGKLIRRELYSKRGKLKKKEEFK